MIAYLDKYDTTVEVPDTASDKDIQDINENFHHYVDPPTAHESQPPTSQPAQPATSQPEAAPTPAPQPKWQPNFYESLLKPFPANLVSAAMTPEGQVFAGKAVEEATFGAAKPLIEPLIAQQEKDHPAFADAGAITGGVGSLMASGGALRIAGLAAPAAAAGSAAVEAGFAAGERFIPRAIMTGATFGTRTFIAETVKHFEEGGVNLEQFGKDVLKDTAFGATFGAIGGLDIAGSKIATGLASISSASGLGFISSKMSGADNREATLNGAIWGAFEAVGQFGKSEALRMEALGNLKGSIGEYIQGRNPDIQEAAAKRAASDFVDHAITKAGFESAEDIAKSGPENLLEGIEKVNQIVRNARVPATTETQTPLLPKLPAPAGAEPGAALAAQPSPQTPFDKAVGFFKDLFGVKEPAPAEPKPGPVVKGRDQYDAVIEDLAKQGHDITSIPEDQIPADLKDIYHYAQAKQVKADISKAITDISGRMTEIGIKADEQDAILSHYGMDKVGQFGQAAIPTDVFRLPIEDQYKQAYSVLAAERGIPAVGILPKPDYDSWKEILRTGIKPPPDDVKGEYKELPLWMKKGSGRGYDEIQQEARDRGLLGPNEDLWVKLRELRPANAKPEKYDARTMDDAEKSVDLINAHFNPQSQEVKNFVEKHGQVSDHDISQMAYDRGMIEEPNPDLLKIEVQKAKQEKTTIHAQIAPGSIASRSTATKAPEVAAHIQASANEITNLVVPSNAAPLAAQITREQLGKMARSYDMAEASLKEAHDLFDKRSKEENLAFIDNMERGQPQRSENLDVIAGTLRKLLDTKRAEIQALGTGKLDAFIENYFPHIWDQGEKEVGQAVQKAAKRPFEGQKSFLKKRSIEFTKEGVEMGLTPVSFNPVDLALLKVREMDKYLMAHRTLKEYKKNGLAKYVKIGGDFPEGWQKIDDRISTVFKSPMIAVKEAFDEQMVEDLNSVATGLGIDLKRSATARGEGKKLGDVWGLSMSNSETPGVPGRIWTKFAGPESAIAHELGHQIDHIYGLKEKFLSDPKIDKEMTKLAYERIPAEGSSQKFEDYVQEPSEKMAAMMEAYIHAPELLKNTAPATYAKLIEFLKSDPKLAPLTEIKPGMVMGTREDAVHAGGAVIAGHVYAQPDAARIINNYLSPGLQKSSVYQAYRYAGNLINQFQLGFSAFHLGFTSLDAAVSKFALALNQLVAGNPVSAVKNALETPFAPIQNIIRGDDLLKAWRGEGKNDSDNVLATIMASAGGRARMDQFYATRAYDQMKHHFESGNLVRGILHIPLSIAELSSKPILEYIVPRQKLGVFSDMIKMEMENNPNMTHEEIREIAQRAWDSVDNRMGQLVYDNLFWNRTFKDLLMGSVRSVGWNLGTIREIAGGAKDYAEAVKNAATGKKTEFSYRMAYLTSLPIIVGMLGAITQYLRTGKGPQEIKDYYFPKTGGVDAHGDPHRIAFPSYMKDLYHYSQAPVQTIANKLNPLLGAVEQMLENKDFYGTKIRNEDDPLVKQVTSEVAYMLKQVTPFSIRNMMKNQETGNKSLFDTVGPWVGITPAPYDIDQTKAEKAAHEIAASHQQIGGRTEEQMERSRLISDLTRQYRTGDPQATDNLYKAYESGAISHRQMQEVIVNARLTPLQRMVKNMTLEETERVYAKSNDEEKAQIERYLNHKQATRGREFVAH